MNLTTIDDRMPAIAKLGPKGYIHARTFFQGDRRGAHDLVGELLARGITQIAIAEEGGDITVAWREPTPPNVIDAAGKTAA